jgi:hypothetical protein
VKIRHEPLLAIALKHEFYGDGPASDLAFVTPAPTARLLAGGRLIAKERASTVTVHYEAAERRGALVPIAGATLQFGLRLVDPLFSNYTALPLLPAGGLPLYRNSGDTRKLDAPVSLFLNQARAEDRELMRLALFAMVEIKLDAGFYDSPSRFEITFAARREELKYYVVMRKYSKADSEALVVTDTRAAAGDDHIDFERVPASAFRRTRDLDENVLTGGEGRVLLFRSRNVVPRRAEGRAGIALELNGTALIPNLPQPARAPSADLIVHLSKP